MWIDFKKYNLPIEDIELDEEDQILVLKTSSYNFEFRACGSNFGLTQFRIIDKPFSFIIGKIIKDMNNTQISFVDTDEVFNFIIENDENKEVWLIAKICDNL